MADHDHTWTPISGKPGRLQCTCGTQAIRLMPTGEIRILDPRVVRGLTMTISEPLRRPVYPTTAKPRGPR